MGAGFPLRFIRGGGAFSTSSVLIILPCRLLTTSIFCVRVLPGGVLAGRAAIVGDIPSAAFKLNRGRRCHAFHRTTAGGAFLQMRAVDFFDFIDMFAAL